ncbi:hypothetical protein ACMYSQ_010656 [Aspergillus niger]
MRPYPLPPPHTFFPSGGRKGGRAWDQMDSMSYNTYGTPPTPLPHPRTFPNLRAAYRPPALTGARPIIRARDSATSLMGQEETISIVIISFARQNAGNKSSWGWIRLLFLMKKYGVFPTKTGLEERMIRWASIASFIEASFLS